PYIHTSMKRKQIVHSQPKQLAKTTTIYLPSYYQIKKPTLEINSKLDRLDLLLNTVKDRVGHLDVYKEHYHWIIERTNTKSYRIIIRDNHKDLLSRIRLILGLSNS